MKMGEKIREDDGAAGLRIDDNQGVATPLSR